MKMTFGSVAALLLSSSAVFAAAHAETDVTIVLSEELDIVDACEASRSNVGRVVLQNVAETMTEMVPGTGVQPRLATEWEDMGDGKWRFHLREGVKFHDGTDLDAGDVAHSLARVKSDQISCEIGAKFFGGIELTTEVIDDTTIDITADPAQPIMPLLMSTVTVVPSETPMDSFVDTPIGTGPYTFEEYARGQHIKLAQNPDYWGEAPEVTGATYVFRSDSSVRSAMVAAGEADIAPNIALQDATEAATDFSYPNSESVYMRPDVSMAPLDDQRVREALNYAIDREAFIGTILADGTLLSTALVPPSTLGYNADLEPFPYDLEKARSLLEEAKADGVPVDTEIVLVGRINNWGNVLETMEALQAMWQDAGFNIKLEMVEVAEWLDRYSNPFPEDRSPEIVAAMHDNANGDPVFSVFFKYASEGLQTAVRDPELDRMIEEATVATGAEREAKWAELFKYIHTDMVYDVQLFHMVGFSRVNPRLDFQPTIRTNSELQLSQIGFK
jgi:peptide/nickel transport system substrate-binding protein